MKCGAEKNTSGETYLGEEDLLEKGMAIHSSILAWRVQWTEGLASYSLRGRKESDNNGSN